MNEQAELKKETISEARLACVRDNKQKLSALTL
jgi:hypothetical protein